MNNEWGGGRRGAEFPEGTDFPGEGCFFWGGEFGMWDFFVIFAVLTDRFNH